MKITKMLTIGALALFIGACASVKPYPLDTCIVSDNELGSMGDSITMAHEGQEIKFCCKPCIKKFKKEPERYLKKLK
ncbi:MAG: hypothetical protein NE328_15525 [Lentisphaeraceae bacterium]|nr:hypothetical protein [Lentisphaeraceae bacterium]